MLCETIFMHLIGREGMCCMRLFPTRSWDKISMMFPVDSMQCGNLIFRVQNFPHAITVTLNRFIEVQYTDRFELCLQHVMVHSVLSLLLC